MKYLVSYGYGNVVESNSRNAKNHLRNLGGEVVIITNKAGDVISKAVRNEAGSPINVTIEKEDEN